jgi:hypothetical protein
MSNFAKPLVAYAVQKQQVFRTPKLPVPLTMLDYLSRQTFANERDPLQFFSRSNVNVDSFAWDGRRNFAVPCRRAFSRGTRHGDKRNAQCEYYRH